MRRRHHRCRRSRVAPRGGTATTAAAAASSIRSVRTSLLEPVTTARPPVAHAVITRQLRARPSATSSTSASDSDNFCSASVHYIHTYNVYDAHTVVLHSDADNRELRFNSRSRDLVNLIASFGNRRRR